MNFVTPSGFRDVLSDEALVRERVVHAVQQVFAARGYVPIETPTLEVMDVMQAGGRLPGSPFRFFDARGDLLAMRPDVTLQVARMCATRLADVEGPLRFRYTQRVFREAETEMQATAREHTQIGIECIGVAGTQADAEVVSLLAQALEAAGVRSFSLAIATVGVLRALLDRSGAQPAWRAQVLEAYHASNFVEVLDRLTDAAFLAASPDAAGVAPAYAQAVRALARIRGGREAIDQVRALVAPLGCEDGLDDFACTYDALAEAGLAERILVDFSVMGSSLRLLHRHRVRSVRPPGGHAFGQRRPLRQHDRRLRDPPSRRRLRVLFRTGLGSGFWFRRPTGRRNNPCASRCPKARSTLTPWRRWGRQAWTWRGWTIPGGADRQRAR